MRFYLYVRQLFNPRKPVDNELISDEHNLEFIYDYLNNETTVVDPSLHYYAADWTDFRGIQIENIQLKSTCKYFSIFLNYKQLQKEF